MMTRAPARGEAHHRILPASNLALSFGPQPAGAISHPHPTDDDPNAVARGALPYAAELARIGATSSRADMRLAANLLTCALEEFVGVRAHEVLEDRRLHDVHHEAVLHVVAPTHHLGVRYVLSPASSH